MLETLKGLLELEGRRPLPSPKSVFTMAYAMEWIDDDQGWLDLLGMRNQTSHVYNEAMAHRIYDQIRQRAYLFRELSDRLKARFE